ncbi:UTP--glucose-1-phosphate uridylyltransferase [Deferrisoma sp.]
MALPIEEALARFEAMFREAGEPPEAFETFARLYRRYRQGETGTVEWDRIEPAGPEQMVPLEAADTPEARREGERRWGELVWIVLNGGLGTSMKMDRAKSLVPVKGNRSFLDLLADHVLRLRRRTGVELPVLFMNSFATRDDTLRALAGKGLEVRGLPLDFVQHRFPRIREDDGGPLGAAGDRDAWAPPGHGNLYAALAGSGVLERLLDAGIRWAFVSNADNLGASPHLGLLGHLANENLQFALEVTPKTEADVKGGTLVVKDGRLELLEIAQVPPGREAEFQDIRRFRVFNTNNLWVDLAAVRDLVSQGRGLELPLIVNRKEARGVGVVQLETAMGAAIGAFERSRGIVVGRERFAPVKTTDDLLARRSDAYVPGDESPLVPNPERDPALGPLVIRLDPRYYRSVADLDLRIPDPPSLVRARRLEVRGDVRFGRGVVVVGDAIVENPGGEPLRVPDGERLGG